MALITVYHVVASYYPVHDATITAGMAARLVTVADQPEATFAIGDSLTTHRTIGIFGDTVSTTAAGTAYAANVIINARGNTRSTQNRVSDMFDETTASGMITVYHSGGEFWTDQYVTTDNFFISGPLYTNAAGLFTITASTENRVLATLVNVPSAYPSGVPGTDVQGSMSLGTFIRIKLEI